MKWFVIIKPKDDMKEIGKKTADSLNMIRTNLAICLGNSHARQRPPEITDASTLLGSN